jgi:hypothetical protein
MASTTPHRLSQRNTNRFESVIRTLVASDGTKNICFDPSHLGINSVSASARLSDALLALLNGHTSLPHLDVERLRTLRPLVRVTTLDNGNVCLVPKTKKETAATELPVDLSSKDTQTDLAVITCGELQAYERVLAFALLLGSRDFVGRVRLKGFDRDELTNLLSNYDIALTPDLNDLLMF